MPEPPARVVLLSLDGLPHQAVSPELMPCLWALGAAGGRAPDGGRCALPSSTYPSHATMLTGILPGRNGIHSNNVSPPHPGVVPGWAGNLHVGVPTVFDACRVAGIPTAAVLSDYVLYRVLSLADADRPWPSGAVVQTGTPIDPFGYPTNDVTVSYLLEASMDRAARLIVGHLSEPDTFGHIYGPDSSEASAAYTHTDAAVGTVIDILAADWDRTVLIVLSDHGMEPLAAAPPIHLAAEPRLHPLIAEMTEEGGSALIRLRPGVSPQEAGAALVAVDGVAGWSIGGPNYLIVAGQPGRIFSATSPKAVKGFHGGPGATRTHLANNGLNGVGRIGGRWSELMGTVLRRR